jgi:hypothetical protein
VDYLNRRGFLQQLAAIALARSVQHLSGQEPPVYLTSAPYSRAYRFSSLSSWITPNSEFFVRSHFGIPRLDTVSWELTVTGVRG